MKKLTKKLSMITLSTALLLTASPFVNEGLFNQNSAVEAATATGANAPQNLKVFTDIGYTYQYYNEIRFLINKGVLNPTMVGEKGVDKFNPDNTATRKDIIEFIGKSLNLDATQRKTVFKDVPKSDPLSGLIQSAYEAGIVNGYGDGTFRGNTELNRGHMAAFIARAYKLTKTSNYMFKDVSKKHSNYLDINKLYTAGITNGYGNDTFKPDVKLSRIHTALFVARAIGFDSEAPYGKDYVQYKSLSDTDDSYLMQLQSGENVLINPGNDYSSVKANLDKYKVSSINRIVITDQTKIGALDSILTNYEVKRVLHSKKYVSNELQEISTKHKGKVIFNAVDTGYQYINDKNNLYVLYASNKGELSFQIGEFHLPQVAFYTNLDDNKFKEIVSNTVNVTMLRQVQTVVLDKNTVKNNISKTNVFYNESNKTGNVRKVYGNLTNSQKENFKSSATLYDTNKGTIIYP